jgi:serine/threonine-protein kinase
VIRKKYEILSEIGRGGMGVVYRARHLIWNEEKALKILTAEGAGAQQGLKGLLAEAQVMRQLQHPHIVRVEDADYTEDEQPFVVMEYVAGQSVRERLQSGGTLAPELALRIASETCSALSAAHRKGIVHRDIKPQNLLLARGADGSESVKVIDFGIAKVREDAGLGFTGIMTGTTGYFVCTPAYASPEQAQGMRGSDLDGRSDLYSLGLVLYELLTGRLPFAADNVHRAIAIVSPWVVNQLEQPAVYSIGYWRSIPAKEIVAFDLTVWRNRQVWRRFGLRLRVLIQQKRTDVRDSSTYPSAQTPARSTW